MSILHSGNKVTSCVCVWYCVAESCAAEQSYNCNETGVSCASVAVSAINAVDAVTPWKSHLGSSNHFHEVLLSAKPHTTDDDNDGHRRLSSILSDCESSLSITSEFLKTPPQQQQQPDNSQCCALPFTSPLPPPSVAKMHRSCSFRVSSTLCFWRNIYIYIYVCLLEACQTKNCTRND